MLVADTALGSPLSTSARVSPLMYGKVRCLVMPVTLLIVCTMNRMWLRMGLELCHKTGSAETTTAPVPAARGHTIHVRRSHKAGRYVRPIQNQILGPFLLLIKLHSLQYRVADCVAVEDAFVPRAR